MAAVLACGPDAVLSHRSAAALWGLRPTGRSGIEVTAPRGRHGHHGITLHRVRQLHPHDRARREHIPVTAVPRTLLDLAEVVRVGQLERAVEASERLRLFDLAAVQALLARSPGRHGLAPLREVIAAYVPQPVTRSEFERCLLPFCDAWGIRRPETNVVVEGHEVDALWREERLIGELDGRAFHDTAAAFERDRLRDTDLQLAGYKVLRITWRRLTREPAAVAETLRRGLDSRVHRHGDDRLRRGRTVEMVASRGPR
jgi:hypothetical protein